MIQQIDLFLIHGLILGTSFGILTPPTSEPFKVKSKVNSIGGIVNFKDQQPCTTLAVGQTCESSNKHRQCPTNSECQTEGDILTNMKCVCKSGYTSTSNGDQCVRFEGSRCSNIPDECGNSSTFLFCIDSYCKCEPSDKYNPVTKKCEGRVGGICYTGIKNCTANSDCVHSRVHHSYKPNVVERVTMELNRARVNSDIEISGRCECQQGYVESSQGLCKKGYGRTCSSESECDELNLVCKEGTCDCPDSLQTYDFQSQSCVALAGATCSDYLIVGGTSCINGAFCKRLNLKRDGRCHCIMDSLEMPDRTCGRMSMWTPV